MSGKRLSLGVIVIFSTLTGCKLEKYAFDKNQIPVFTISRSSSNQSYGDFYIRNFPEKYSTAREIRFKTRGKVYTASLNDLERFIIKNSEENTEMSFVNRQVDKHSLILKVLHSGEISFFEASIDQTQEEWAFSAGYLAALIATGEDVADPIGLQQYFLTQEFLFPETLYFLEDDSIFCPLSEDQCLKYFSKKVKIHEANCEPDTVIEALRSFDRE